MAQSRRPPDRPLRPLTQREPARFDDDDDKFTPPPVSVADPTLWHHTNRQLERQAAKVSQVRELFDGKVGYLEEKMQHELAALREDVRRLDALVQLHEERINNLIMNAKDYGAFTKWVIMLCVGMAGVFAAIMRMIYGSRP